MRKLLLLVPSLLFLLTGLLAQKTTVTGKVTDEKGIAIPNASIKIKGTKTGTAADNQGSFTVSVDPGAKLIISAAGYAEKEVDASDNLTVQLVETSKVLNEVIVTSQGIRKKSREIGYSYSKLSNSEVNVGRAPQLGQALSGKVSGLAVYNINNSVDPQVKIVLRGYRSLTGNNEALVVLDGMQTTTTALGVLNPNDVESITILKGGQAATLYGSAGTNGAIVITTKKGAKGKLKVSFSNSTNFEQISFLPEFQEKYGSGSQYYPIAYGQAGYSSDYLVRMKENWRPYENQQYGDAYDGSLRLAGRTLQDSSRLVIPYAHVDNARRKSFDVGYSVNNQVNFQGGDETSTFYLSVENSRTHGIVPNDESERTGIRVAATKELDKLSVGFNASYAQAGYDRATSDFYNDIINTASWFPVHEMRDWRENKFANPNGYYNDYYNNPYFNADINRAKYKDANLQGNLDLTYKFTPWLQATNKLGVMNNSRTGKNTTEKFLYSDWAKNDAYIVPPWDHYDDYPGIYRAIGDILGSVNDYSTTENVINNEFQLHLTKDFGDFSNKLVLGSSVYQRTTKAINVGSSSIVVPDVYNVSNRQGELTGGEANTQERKYGYYADLTTNFRDWLIFNGTFRYDYTSRFYKDYRSTDLYSFPYYGLGLSFILTDAVKSLQGKLLNYAKIRVNFNKNGNDNIPLYGLDLVYPNGANFPFGNTVGLTVGNTLPDTKLKPEEVTSYEAGGEFQLFNNKVNLDVAAYYQKSIDQVITVKIPATTGFSNLLINVGETKNWGYEADLKVIILRDRKLKWDVSVRYSYNDNVVVSLYPGITEFQYGGYSYATTNIIQDQRFPYLKTDGYRYAEDGSGRRLVSPTTGYPLRNTSLLPRGGTIPRHIVGAGSRLAFGDLVLAFNFEYRGGNYMFSDLGRQMTFTGSGKWTENRAPHIFPNSAYLDANNKPVENTSVYVREPEYALWVSNYRLISENFVSPAWFIKMRDINLTYNFSSNFISKSKIFSAASIAIYGRNLFTVVDKTNYYTDPEYSYTTKPDAGTSNSSNLSLSSSNGLGINNTGQTPPVRQFGFNINLTF